MTSSGPTIWSKQGQIQSKVHLSCTWLPKLDGVLQLRSHRSQIGGITTSIDLLDAVQIMQPRILSQFLQLPVSAKTQEDLEQWHSLWKKFCCNSLDESLPGMADGLSKATGQKISSLGSTSYLLALTYTPRFCWHDLSHFSFLSFFLPFFLFFNFFLFFLPFFLFFFFLSLKMLGGCCVTPLWSLHLSMLHMRTHWLIYTVVLF